jgi:hypothetical protein
MPLPLLCSRTQIAYARQGAGYVRFVRDKEKKLSRIEWNASLSKILKDAVARPEMAPAVHETTSPSNGEIETEAAVRIHSFMMGDGRTLSLPYPSDLSIEDATRIGKFYESVALPRSRAAVNE